MPYRAQQTGILVVLTALVAWTFVQMACRGPV
jgi:hypothetical protein